MTSDPPPSRAEADPVGLLVIGGGVNGCGIARDAAGRGLSVILAERGDLGGATSSASTKLFHGGLRYLEFLELRLVREALAEREVLLRAMPHISWPMRFVLPIHQGMRFDSDTPVSRVLSMVLPWMKGRRPAWLIRMGLFLYDHLGGREILPGTASLDLGQDVAGVPLKPKYRRAFEYSDCWVEDSRLVVLNARDAAARGATILTRTCVVAAERSPAEWVVTLRDETTGACRKVRARAVVNATGPWVADVLQGTLGQPTGDSVRLVRGSHIVTRRLFDHDKCYFLQGRDGRIVFAIPYEGDFTLIGTTDADHPCADTAPVCTDEERRYLLDFVSDYFEIPVTENDIVWTYSGVRPLYDDGAKSATTATRDYVLTLDTEGGAPLLNVIGGKITTYRKLSDGALDRLARVLPGLRPGWTAGVPLPGGDFPVDGVNALIERLAREYPFLDQRWARRLVRAYGTESWKLLGDARSLRDLGQAFGATITARELDWAIGHEWVRCGEDFLWRRTRLGLKLDDRARAAVSDYVAAKVREIDGTGDDPALPSYVT